MSNQHKKILHAFEYKNNLIVIIALIADEKHVLINNSCMNRDFYHEGSVAECIGKAVCKIDNLHDFYDFYEDTENE
jgi:hypothetical protein